MNLNQIHNVYFIGIGGIGMSALLFKNIGKEGFGYDKTPTALTKELIDSGIAIILKIFDLFPKIISSKTLSYYYPCCS
jgi:UDP-N-acetylmuramate--alanine ligase